MLHIIFTNQKKPLLKQLVILTCILFLETVTGRYSTKIGVLQKGFTARFLLNVCDQNSRKIPVGSSILVNLNPLACKFTKNRTISKVFFKDLTRVAPQLFHRTPLHGSFCTLQSRCWN